MPAASTEALCAGTKRAGAAIAARCSGCGNRRATRPRTMLLASCGLGSAQLKRQMRELRIAS